MNFERGKDPLRAMGIGHSQKREFASIQEAAEWALLFPAEYTEGRITKWTRDFVNNGQVSIPGNINHGWLQMVKWMKDNIRIPSLFGNEKIGLKEAKNVIDIMREMLPAFLYKGENIMARYKSAKDEIYEHVGFKEDWVVYPIDDRTSMYWTLNGDSEVRYAKTEEDLNDEASGNFYVDEIYKQRFYSKWIYEGEDLTMIFCDPGTDGMKWFGIFSNSLRIR